MRKFHLLLIAIQLITCNALRYHNRPLLQNRPIVGGVDAQITSIPYQVSLGFASKISHFDDENNTETVGYHHFCGGSIISVEWVLTAAHCIKSDDDYEELSSMYVRVGSHINYEGGSLHKVARFVYHAGFDFQELDSDVGVIKVKEPFEFGPTVQPIPLTKYPRVPGGIVTVSGWGSTTEYGDAPKQLQKVSMQADSMVFLDLNEETFDYRHFCGGSIISMDWILTAAHCIIRTRMTDDRFKYFHIRVGTSSTTEGGHLHEINKCIVHPAYDLGNSNNYDISIIKVKTPFEFSPSVQAITLNKNPIVTGGIATVSGWGTTTMYGDKPDKLQKVNFPILPLWECQLLYKNWNITDYVFCAGRAMRSACHGDSGGPVVYNGMQIGVVSGGANCQRPDYPGIYVNVYRLRDWIHENSGV